MVRGLLSFAQTANGSSPTTVIPAKAGIQATLPLALDPGFRRDDDICISRFPKSR